MIEPLRSYVAGRWVEGTGAGTTLFDPVIGAALARVERRARSGGGLRASRATRAGRVARAHLRPASGHAGRASSRRCKPTATRTSRSPSPTPGPRCRLGDRYRRRELHARPICASWGAALGDVRALAEGTRGKLARTARSCRSTCRCRRAASRCSSTPSISRPGACGRRRRAALLSGVPVIVKPATSTRWLAQRMVADVIGPACCRAARCR